MKKKVIDKLALIGYAFYMLFAKDKRADLPGWSYVIALIIGLFVIAFLIWLAIKSTGKQVDILEFLR